MIITNNIAKNNLIDYSNKNNKISRDIKSGKLFKIINGLYETDLNTPGYLLAGSIYGPSYISFEINVSAITQALDYGLNELKSDKKYQRSIYKRLFL